MKYQKIRDLCAPSGLEREKYRCCSPTKMERAEVLRKTGGRCHVCGSRLTKKWRVDHVIPHYLGGAATLENRLPICRVCNGLRGGTQTRGDAGDYAVGGLCHEPDP